MNTGLVPILRMAGVFPGFVDIEANNADPFQPGSSAAPGAVLSRGADGSHT